MRSIKITKGLFIFYLIALVWIILFKCQFTFAGLPHYRNINLIPFAGSVITNGKINLGEIVYNILVFIPYGVFAGMLWQEKPFLAKIAPVFFTSLILETLQFILAVGASDITDLIGNTSGGVIGIGIFAVLSKIFKEKVQQAVNIISVIAASLIVLLMAVILIVNI